MHVRYWFDDPAEFSQFLREQVLPRMAAQPGTSNTVSMLPNTLFTRKIMKGDVGYYSFYVSACISTNPLLLVDVRCMIYDRDIAKELSDALSERFHVLKGWSSIPGTAVR
jgi:hypothetical protein